MDNKENILDELTNFEKRKPKEIPQILEDYLIRIAKTGDTMFPWTKLKPLFMFKMERVISEFHENSPTDDLIPCPNMERFKFDAMKEKLLEAIDNFSSSAPFTIQRLCELITSPRKHYKHTEKFMRGLEKNVLVVSTVEPGCSHIFACDCARKRSDHQNSALMNGILDTHNGVDNENNNGEFISKEISILPPSDISSEYTESGQHQSPELTSVLDEEKADVHDIEMKSVNMNGSQEAMDTSPLEDGEPLLPTVVDEPTPFVAETKVDTPLTTEVMTPVADEVKSTNLTEMDTTVSTEVEAPVQTDKIVVEASVTEPVIDEATSKESDILNTAKEIEHESTSVIAAEEQETQEKGSCNSDNTVSSSTHSPSSSSVTTVTAATSEATSSPVVEESNREASHFAEAEVVLADKKEVEREAGGDATNTKAEKLDDRIDSSSVDSQPLSPIDDAKSEASVCESHSESLESEAALPEELKEVQAATSSDNDTIAVKTEVTGSDQQVIENSEENTLTKSNEAEQPSSSDVNDENKISASSELTAAPIVVKEEEEESMVTTSPNEEATSTPSLTTPDVVMAAPSLEAATSADESSSLPLQAESSSSSSSSSSSPSTSSLSPQHITTTETDNTNEANAADSSPCNEPVHPSNAEVTPDEPEPMEQD